MIEKNDLIIESPHLQTGLQKYTHAFLTFAFWLLWVYLWSPIITLIFWLLGFHQFYYHMVKLGGYVGLREQLLLYLVIILAIGFVQLTWAKYNQFRFRGKERRKHQPNVSHSAVFKFFQVDESKIETFKISQVLKLHFDALSNITCVQDISASVRKDDWGTPSRSS